MFIYSMGNSNSSWVNKPAHDCLLFLRELFGNPSSYVPNAGGWAIWKNKVLLNKTLFGKNVCFEKIMILDEGIEDKPGQKNFLYVTVVAPIGSNKLCDFNKIVPNCGYDITKKYLWVRSSSIDNCVAILKTLTDFGNGKTTLDQYPAVLDSLIESINNTSNIGSRVEIVKVLYIDLCSNLAKLMTNKEHMTAWYSGDVPYYAMNQPGNVTLGEEENEMFYRRLREKPIAPSSFDEPPSVKLLGEEIGVERLSSKCNGACIDRYYSVMKEGMSAAPVKRSSVSTKLPATLAQAYALFQPRAEYLNLFSVDAHNSKLENFIDTYDIFQPGSSAIPIQLPNKKIEYLGPGDQLTLRQAYALFQPKNVLTKASALQMENMSDPMNMGNMYDLFRRRPEVSLQLFQLRGSSSKEHMNTSLGVDSQVAACQLFLKEVGREHMTSDSDPRFLPYTALINHQVGSDIVDIDRVYGTKAQKIRYPKYTDLLQYGITSVPKETFVGDQFYE
jgi:hypothetical protein